MSNRKIGCFSAFGLFLLVAACVGIFGDEEEKSDKPELPIKIESRIEANKDGKAEISGKTEPGASVELYLGSKLMDKEKADKQGNFAFDVETKPNSTSEYTVKAKIEDKSGEKRVTVIGPEILAVTLTVDKSIETTKDKTTLEGETEPEAKVTLRIDDKVLDSKKADSDGNFKFTLNTSKDEVFNIKSEKEGYESKTEFIAVKRVLSKAEQKAKYKKSCKAIAYKKLKKNPDKYAGEKYKARGQILQIMEGFGTTQMRIAVTKTSWGWDFDDVIYVTYEGTTDFVEEDVVTVYGEVTGSYSYTSVAGWNITVPGVDVKYIEK